MGVQIEIDKVSQANLNKAIRGLADMEGDFWKATVKVLFNIKALAQLRLTDRGHVVTSRLKNSIYVKTPKQEHAGAAENNSVNYRDKDGKTYNADLLTVSLGKQEGAVGTNVEYAAAVENGCPPHKIRVKNKKVLYNFRTGQFFGREVNHPGFAGDSYLYWAVKNAGTNVRQYFEEVVKRRANNKFMK